MQKKISTLILWKGGLPGLKWHWIFEGYLGEQLEFRMGCRKGEKSPKITLHQISTGHEQEVSSISDGYRKAETLTAT